MDIFIIILNILILSGLILFIFKKDSNTNKDIKIDEGLKQLIQQVSLENNTTMREANISEIFKTMERKLYFYIMTPAMTLSWLFGFILIHSIGFQQLGQTWMLLKLLFVIILTLYHFYLGRLLSQFNIGNNRHSHKFYRYINEIPTILLILIIFVVIFKPI